MKKLLLAAVAASAFAFSAHAEDAPDGWSQCSTAKELDEAVQKMGGRAAAVLTPDNAPTARIVIFAFPDGHYAVVVLPDVTVDRACVRETGKLMLAETGPVA